MKTYVILALALGAGLVPVRAQLFSNEALGGAALGGLIGGIIGHNSGRHTAEGAGIGAGAGLLLGTLANRSRAAQYEVYEGYPPAGAVYAPQQRSSYAFDGAVLGGIAGGVIGHNSGRHTAEGIAIGAASGLILGAVADQSVRRQVPAQPRPGTPAYVVQTVPTPALQTVNGPTTPAPITTTPQPTAPSSSMAAANSLFGR